jgi:hypothetical protein
MVDKPLPVAGTGQDLGAATMRNWRFAGVQRGLRNVARHGARNVAFTLL